MTTVPVVKKPRRGGRKPGSLNRSTLELRELAKSHGEDCITVLAAMMTMAASESVRVNCAIALLDRGYGKPMQKMEVVEVPHIDQTGWSKQRLAAFHGVEVAQIEAIQDQAQDEF